MNIANVFTGGLAVLAAVQGGRAAPVTSDPPGVFQIESIRNCGSPLPAPLQRALDSNYQACRRSDVFGTMSRLAQEVLCLTDGAVNTAFRATLDEPLPDIATLREGVHRMLRDRSHNPLGSPATAGHSLKKLRHANFNDYKEQRSAMYADGIERMVNVLLEHVPPQERGSVATARAATRSPACRKALDAIMPSLVRAEVAARRSLVTLREIRDPQSISAEQADLLRADLDRKVFDPSPLKERMRTDALEALVESTTDQRSVATDDTARR